MASTRYLYLASKQSNKWGHPHGYCTQTVSFSGGPLPQNSFMERAFSWGRWGCGRGGKVAGPSVSSHARVSDSGRDGALSGVVAVQGVG